MRNVLVLASAIVWMSHVIPSNAEIAAKPATIAISHAPGSASYLTTSFIEAELSDLQTKLTTVASTRSHQPQNEELIVVTAETLNESPLTLKISLIRSSDNLILKSTIVKLTEASGVFERQSELTGISIARKIVRDLDNLNYDIRLQEVAAWSGEPSETRWFFEDINGCKQNYLVRQVEESFPGTISISLDDSPTANYSIFNYSGVANLQRQSEWLDTLLRYEGLTNSQFKIISSQQGLRVIFTDPSPIAQSNCGGNPQ